MRFPAAVGGVADPAGAGAAAAPVAAKGRRDRRYGLLLTGMLWFQTLYMVLYITDPTAPVVNGVNPMAANPLSRMYKLVLLGLAAVVIGSRMQLAREVLLKLNRAFPVFFALALLSVVWSIDPSVTAARLVALASMVSVCVAFGVGAWYPKRLQDVLRAPITLVLIASLIVGMFDPILVKETGDTISLKNAWHGLTSQKNEFGELSSFGIILWFHGWLARDVRWYQALAGTAISGVCLILSRSSTSLLCTVLAVTLMLILMRSGPATRRYMPYIVGSFAVLCALYGLSVMKIVPGIEKILLDPVMKITGKSMDFSGRTDIWQIVGENIARHPYLGSGYAAYWGAGPIPSSPSYEFVGRMYGFWPTESHNGYYEIRNDLGIVGLLCLLGYMFIYLRQSISLFRIDRAQSTLFLALLFQQTLLNLSESTWLDIDNFCFTVMTAATVVIARSLVEHKRGNYGPGIKWPKSP